MSAIHHEPFLCPRELRRQRNFYNQAKQLFGIASRTTLHRPRAEPIYEEAAALFNGFHLSLTYQAGSGLRFIISPWAADAFNPTNLKRWGLADRLNYWKSRINLYPAWRAQLDFRLRAQLTVFFANALP